MMRSLYAGVSGLKGHQTRMDVIGNNIANVNTTGFKSSRTTFADTLSQTVSGASTPSDNIGGTNPKQIGLGMGIASIDTIFTNGSVQATGKNTDLCLSGNGLFVVKQGSQVYYTRDGAFEFDANGNYVLPGSGHLVQGWMAKDGELPASRTDANMDKITIAADTSIPPSVTTQATYAGNIDAGSANSTAITTTLPVYDTQGYQTKVPIIFTKTGTNTWSLSSSASNVSFSTTSITFDGNGNLIGPTTGQTTITMTVSSGANTPVTVATDISGITQYNAESTVHSSKSDGYSEGKLESISIDSSGVVTGVYTNGVRRTEAQVAVAQFSNAAGLTKTGNSFYQESNNSGKAHVGEASALGVTITPSALEMSNVDIANEFSDMIVTQRGFQSNSKIITVSDEMLETMINMKR